MFDLALLTQHGKAPAVADALLSVGYAVRLVDGFDTDQLGTFTRDKPRQGNALDAAVTKAKLAADLGHCRFGLGSEGSFGADPYLATTSWGAEVLAWWDAVGGYGVHAVVQGPETNYGHMAATTRAVALAFAQRSGFPSHGIIVGTPQDPWFQKELNSEEALEAQIDQALQHGIAWLETDMRAHRNPTRMAMIRRCSTELAQKLTSLCPVCRHPGFGITHLVPGAICELCGETTRVARWEQTSCPCCHHITRRNLRETVSPVFCDYCNP